MFDFINSQSCHKFKYDKKQIKMKFKISPLEIGLIAAGIIGFGYLLKTYSGNEARMKEIVEMKEFSLQLTQRISNELRYIFLNLSIKSASTKYLQRINQLPFPQRAPALSVGKEGIVKFLQEEQQKVLTKFKKTHSQYIKALKFYEEDDVLRYNQEEVKKILKACLAFEYPDLSVSPQAASVHSKTQILQIGRQLNFFLLILLWRQVKEEKRKNPEFNHDLLENKLKVNRNVNLFHQKDLYLAAKGYDSRWGDPNYIFKKIYENYKKEDQDFKNKAKAIEKGGEQFFAFLLNNFDLSEEGLKVKHNEFIRLAEQDQPQRPPESRAPQVLAGSTEGSQPVSHQHQQQRTLQQFWESRVNQFRQSDYSSGRDNTG